MLLALKIDVDTLRGTREGVPNLVELLRRYQAGATFLFSVGPDHTGRAIKRVLRPGFFGKVRRTSVVGLPHSFQRPNIHAEFFRIVQELSLIHI